MPSDPGGVIRVVHDREHPYVMVSRALAQRRGLSYEARGLMLYLLSKPKDWQARMADLQAEGGIKRTALRSILHELQAAGYLVRERIWNPDTKRLTWVTSIYETPPTPDKQSVDFQPIGDQPVALQSVDAPPIYIVETLQRTELQKTEAPAPTQKASDANARAFFDSQIRALCRERRWPPPLRADLDTLWAIGYDALVVRNTASLGCLGSMQELIAAFRPGGLGPLGLGK